MSADVVDLAERRETVAYARLLTASKAALEAMDTLTLAQLAEGLDSRVRAELAAAIWAIEEEPQP